MPCFTSKVTCRYRAAKYPEALLSATDRKIILSSESSTSSIVFNSGAFIFLNLTQNQLKNGFLFRGCSQFQPVHCFYPKNLWLALSLFRRCLHHLFPFYCVGYYN